MPRLPWIAGPVELPHTLRYPSDSFHLLYGWGYNRSGQFGTGGGFYQPPPTAVTALVGIEHAGAGHTHLLLMDATHVHAAGANDYYQLGDGARPRARFPCALPSAPSWRRPAGPESPGPPRDPSRGTRPTVNVRVPRSRIPAVVS